MDETQTSVDAAFVQVKPPNCKFRPTHLDAPRRTPADCNRSPSGALLGSPWGGVRRRQRSIAKMYIVRGVRSLWENSTLAVGRIVCPVVGDRRGQKARASGRGLSECTTRRPSQAGG